MVNNARKPSIYKGLRVFSCILKISIFRSKKHFRYSESKLPSAVGSKKVQKWVNVAVVKTINNVAVNSSQGTY